MIQKVCEESYYMLIEIIFCLKSNLSVNFFLNFEKKIFFKGNWTSLVPRKRTASKLVNSTPSETINSSFIPKYWEAGAAFDAD